jgi:Rieske Fe-S protein
MTFQELPVGYRFTFDPVEGPGGMVDPKTYRKTSALTYEGTDNIVFNNACKGKALVHRFAGVEFVCYHLGCPVTPLDEGE